MPKRFWEKHIEHNLILIWNCDVCWPLGRLRAPSEPQVANKSQHKHKFVGRCHIFWDAFWSTSGSCLVYMSDILLLLLLVLSLSLSLSLLLLILLLLLLLLWLLCVSFDISLEGLLGNCWAQKCPTFSSRGWQDVATTLVNTNASWRSAVFAKRGQLLSIPGRQFWRFGGLCWRYVGLHLVTLGLYFAVIFCRYMFSAVLESLQ